MAGAAAHSRTFRTRALVLAHTKLAESDLILTLLAEDGSQVRAVAKGARKPGGRLAARTELFSECDLLLAHGRNLQVVTEAQLVDPHAALRGNPPALLAACELAQVALATCMEDAPDPYLFAIASKALAALGQASDDAHLDVLVAAYAWKVLAHGGWRPALDACVACGDEAVSRFSATAGGVLCESCARDAEGAVPVSANDVAWLRALLALTFEQLLAAPVDAATAGRLLSLARTWAETQLDVRLRAFDTTLGM